MLEVLKNSEDFFSTHSEGKAVVLYLTTQDCNVCEVIRPQVETVLESYTDIPAFYVDSSQFPEVAAQNMVFTVPTLLVLYRGRELFKQSRMIQVSQFKQAMEQLKSMMEVHG